MPTFLSLHRLGYLVALVAALTATPWGLATAGLVLAALAGVASNERRRRSTDGAPSVARSGRPAGLAL